jgi:hypothetical protein
MSDVVEAITAGASVSHERIRMPETNDHSRLTGRWRVIDRWVVEQERTAPGCEYRFWEGGEAHCGNKESPSKTVTWEECDDCIGEGE